jgi:hypothetical protein
MQATGYRFDHDSGLVLPAFSPDERRAMRARGMHLLEVLLSGKATAAEQAELAKIDRDLYGPGSGWREDRRTMVHAEQLGNQLLGELKRRGVVRSEDVAVDTNGQWVDAADVVVRL